MQTLTLPAVVADGEWHTLLISHYHAAGKTYTYVDGVLATTADDTAILGDIEIGGIDMEVSDFMLWRSALNADEVAAVESGRMLQSSLEIYCPLNDEISNFAQSTNTVSFQADPTSNEEVKFDNSRTTPEPTPFDLLGRPIDSSYNGIIIELGSKYLRK